MPELDDNDDDRTREYTDPDLDERDDDDDNPDDDSADRTVDDEDDDADDRDGDDDDDEPLTLAQARKLRRENSKLRKRVTTEVTSAVAAARREAEEQYEESRYEWAAKIGRALGVISEDDDEADPEVLLAEATTKAQEADARAALRDKEARESKIELALFRQGEKAGADTSALLDSRSFLETISDLDHTARDFSAQVADAIEDWIEEHPRFKKAAPASTVTTPRSGADLSAGHGDPNSGKPGDTSVDALREARRKRREKR